jgi:diadenosine tetraphosphate (Ap4A) HIT family hydrolase
MGQIAEGHVLLVPKRHVTAMAQLTTIETDQLDDLCGRVRKFLHDAYGECIFFEHGIRKAGSGGCGVEHAHMHAIPVDGGVVLDVLVGNFHGSKIDRIQDIRGTVCQESSYLFFENCHGDRYVFAAPCIPSQYMRKVVCDSLGKCNWDWRNSGDEPELLATLQRVSTEFSQG